MALSSGVGMSRAEFDKELSKYPQVRSKDWQGWKATNGGVVTTTTKPSASSSSSSSSSSLFPSLLPPMSAAPSNSSSVSFHIDPALGFWANFRALLRSKYAPAEAERLFAAFQQLHDDWFKSLSLADLDSIAASVEQELGVAFEAPE